MLRRLRGVVAEAGPATTSIPATATAARTPPDESRRALARCCRVRSLCILVPLMSVGRSGESARTGCRPPVELRRRRRRGGCEQAQRDLVHRDEDRARCSGSPRPRSERMRGCAAGDLRRPRPCLGDAQPGMAANAVAVRRGAVHANHARDGPPATAQRGVSRDNSRMSRCESVQARRVRGRVAGRRRVRCARRARRESGSRACGRRARGVDSTVFGLMKSGGRDLAVRQAARPPARRRAARPRSGLASARRAPAERTQLALAPARPRAARPSCSKIASASASDSWARRRSFRRRWRRPSASSVRARSNGIGSARARASALSSERSAAIELAARGEQEPAAARPRSRATTARGLLAPCASNVAEHRLGPLEVAAWRSAPRSGRRGRGRRPARGCRSSPRSRALRDEVQLRRRPRLPSESSRKPSARR